MAGEGDEVVWSPGLSVLVGVPCLKLSCVQAYVRILLLPRLWLANPDLAKRFQLNAPLNKWVGLWALPQDSACHHTLQLQQQPQQPTSWGLSAGDAPSP